MSLSSGIAFLRRHASRRDAHFFKMLIADYWRSVAPAPHRPDPAAWRDDAITGAWLGHSTVLLNFFGIVILTDPVLGLRCGVRIGPTTIGPKRFVRPALTARELPRIDLVLLTHAHFDHLDRATLRRVAARSPGAQVVTAKNTRDLLRGIRFERITELDWTEAAEIETAAAGAVRVEALEVSHWGARMRHDTHRGYNGYLLERRGWRICFAGDTAFTDFSSAARRGPVDLIAIPIGAYDPWIASHCTPEQAVAMARAAGARAVLPIHHQTFKLSAEPMHEPMERFTQALAGGPERIAATEIGETFRVS